ncbi:hypothetical protein K490DRAFT_39211 [Saccharata proteae CBS 121410]|uniref:DUF7962 domain-containing protein n=1 Tax=Saccharata proteae CBS 121410 TaxID=1314787 RepID=A0A9P4HV78_9PEZI|nr:hypothetical protein K490DRAFT_39211 [Saccharata proteae CBS 121410]
MMPRPILSTTFHLSYRKIPVLAIGRDIYCDTSIILEALEHRFPPAASSLSESAGYASLYPRAADGRNYRALIRGFASYWTDRALFRTTTGLIPSSVWRTHFGVDRAELIGHKLDPDKLGAKVPRNLSVLDMHLSMLEPLCAEATETHPWLFSTPVPSLADVSLYYQLDWGNEIAAGRGVGNLTGGGTEDAQLKGAAEVFNGERYPALLKWFSRLRRYIEALPLTETRVVEADAPKLLEELKICDMEKIERVLVPTAAIAHDNLDTQNRLVQGAQVSVAPDDTGRANPTLGVLLVVTPEEIVIGPLDQGTKAPIDIRIHFPRLGFIVRPLPSSKL